jgi:hypothetical protein
VAKAYVIERREKRIPMEVAVQIAGHTQMPGVEMTFTENVSVHGARVVTVRRWRTNDRLTIASLPGDFRAAARVAYCQSLRDEGFAVGLELLEPTGRWVLGSAESAGEIPNP